MFDRPRIIPVLLLDEGNLVKTIRFAHPNYIGDPINAVRLFNDMQADELCILDISRSDGEINFRLLSEIASEAFMPMSYGGKLRTAQDAIKIFRLGFEKVIFNTALFENADAVTETIQYAGAQSVVASVDFKSNLFGEKTAYTHCGKTNTKFSAEGTAQLLQSLGVGEIFLNSIDCDGKMEGYDLNLIRELSEKIDVPLIACGGAGNLSDMKKAVDVGASAAAAGSIFVYYGPKKGVLINYPTEDEMRKTGL